VLLRVVTKLECLRVDTKLECLQVDTKLECVAFKQRQGFYRGQGETFQNACLRGMAKMFEVCQSSKEMKKRRKVVFLTKIECSNNGLLGKRVEKHLDFTFKREEKRMWEIDFEYFLV